MGFPPLGEKELAYLLEHYPLDRDTLTRLLSDVWSLTSETAETYVVRRHLELQGQGKSNEVIYQKLIRETADGRFTPETFSLRQIRRMIYG